MRNHLAPKACLLLMVTIVGLVLMGYLPKPNDRLEVPNLSAEESRRLRRWRPSIASIFAL
jgi:hypothetical protein